MHCQICGVLEDVGESVICEDCADTLAEGTTTDTGNFVIMMFVSFALGVATTVGLLQ